jgi:hypothetical protein
MDEEGRGTLEIRDGKVYWVQNTGDKPEVMPYKENGDKLIVWEARTNQMEKKFELIKRA